MRKDSRKSAPRPCRPGFRVLHDGMLRSVTKSVHRSTSECRPKNSHSAVNLELLFIPALSRWLGETAASIRRRGLNKTARLAVHGLKALLLKTGIAELAESEFPLHFTLIFRLDDFPMSFQLAIGDRRGQLGFFRSATRQSCG